MIASRAQLQVVVVVVVVWWGREDIKIALLLTLQSYRFLSLLHLNRWCQPSTPEPKRFLNLFADEPRCNPPFFPSKERFLRFAFMEGLRTGGDQSCKQRSLGRSSTGGGVNRENHHGKGSLWGDSSWTIQTRWNSEGLRTRHPSWLLPLMRSWRCLPFLNRPLVSLSCENPSVYYKTFLLSLYVTLRSIITPSSRFVFLFCQHCCFV